MVRQRERAHLSFGDSAAQSLPYALLKREDVGKLDRQRMRGQQLSPAARYKACAKLGGHTKNMTRSSANASLTRIRDSGWKATWYHLH